MAIYTYLCNKCKRKFDILYGKEEPRCDVCQTDDVQRLLTIPMVRTNKQEESSSSLCGSCIKPSCVGCR